MVNNGVYVLREIIAAGTIPIEEEYYIYLRVINRFIRYHKVKKGSEIPRKYWNLILRFHEIQNMVISKRIDLINNTTSTFVVKANFVSHHHIKLLYPANYDGILDASSITKITYEGD